MRIIGAASVAFILAMAFGLSGFAAATEATQAEQIAVASEEKRGTRHRDGQAIFRFDTFGDEQLWTEVLRMHEVFHPFTP